MLKYFYCEECNKIHRANVRENIFYTDKRLSCNIHYLYKCDCGEPAVEIDAYMVNIIKLLNENGMKTIYCCEGHLETNGDYSPAYITFDSSITKEFVENILKTYPLPIGWTLETYEHPEEYPDYDYRACVTLRYTELDEQNIAYNKFQYLKNQYIANILAWCIMIFPKRIIQSSDING